MNGLRKMQAVQPVSNLNYKIIGSQIADYKELTVEDLRNIERIPYADLRSRARKDPVKFMLEAGDLGMDIEQYANFLSPNTFVEQGRSVTDRLMQDEGMYVRSTDISAPSLVADCIDGGIRQVMLYHTLSKSWDRNSIAPTRSLTLQTSSPPGQYPNNDVTGQPPPVATGLRINPGELVATSHSVDANNYNPFKWAYDEADMVRNKVKPGEDIPASTLGETEGAIPMAKWGNRFVLPFEMIIGGQGMRVNKLAQMVALDALTESSRQFTELLGILENGDANATADNGLVQAAEVEGISTFDGTAGEFSFVAFLNWLDEAMDAPFQISHVIMLKAQQRQLRASLAALQGNLALAQLSSVGLAPNTITNMEGQGNIRYGRAPEGSISANYVVGVDSRYAIEKVNRAGMTIRQQAENIVNQTQNVVLSDTYLWSRLSPGAVKILNIAG